MKLYIHDLPDDVFQGIVAGSDSNMTVIRDDGTIHACIGCFGCWVKTPGTCIIGDSYKDIGSLFAQCDELVIISRCVYGGFSPFVKNIMDRSIGFILPYFRLIHGEMHHKPRYKKQFVMTVHLYGRDIMDEEKRIAAELVAGNAVNMNAASHSLVFHEDAAGLKGVRI